MKDINDIVASLCKSGYSVREAQDIVAGGHGAVKAAMEAKKTKKWSKPRPCEACERYANPDRCTTMCPDYRTWFGGEWKNVQALYGIYHGKKRVKAHNGERAVMVGSLHARGWTDAEIADVLDLNWNYIAMVRRKMGLAPNKKRKDKNADV